MLPARPTGIDQYVWLISKIPAFLTFHKNLNSDWIVRIIRQFGLVVGLVIQLVLRYAPSCSPSNFVTFWHIASHSSKFCLTPLSAPCPRWGLLILRYAPSCSPSNFLSFWHIASYGLKFCRKTPLFRPPAPRWGQFKRAFIQCPSRNHLKKIWSL